MVGFSNKQRSGNSTLKGWRNPLATIQQAIEILRVDFRCELCSR
jgi:hypothetical protein